ncbi:SDR family oxidoreductase [Paenibacillus sp. IB182496]|uniref:SDR family oxidoreductase n=1 Tax=Paenibacillus sabuli TaxID=2772509 RepID=A0A927BU72_9BACL|nr:SDR family oxidoreductase [Paenibacillus sabuli]MBD2846897.1 SDR family oxidoreductase [Paenibacillus sabuli]
MTQQRNSTGLGGVAAGDGLEGKIALVSAASQGLGYATALRLTAGGAHVAMFSRSVTRIAQAADRIAEATGQRPLALTGDIRIADDVRRVVAETAEAYGGLDIIVHNAGGPPAGSFEALRDEDWQQAHERNFLSAVRLVREALPHLKQGGGSIVNVVSISVKQPLGGLILSNAYRAAIVGLAKSLADELAPYGIRVNNAAPGRIATERIKELDAHQAKTQDRPLEEIERGSLQAIPLGRYGEPAEFAEAIAFLASDRASYITGATLQVDGGMVRAIQ